MRIILASNARAALVDGVDARLTEKEFFLLEYLESRHEETASREEILAYLYGANQPDQKILDVFICKIRRKLRLLGAPGAIETVWGRGYRFNAA